MNAALVSIVIPCYNAEAWLAETLESALAQTWPNKEIIVVDDGSTDQSPLILSRYQERGVRAVQGPHRNAATARNVGLREAQGDWIQFLDADDLLEKDKIERQMVLASEKGPGYLISGEWDRFVGHPKESAFLEQANWKDMDGIEFHRLLWKECLMMHPAAWLVSRSLIEKAGFWDERLTLNDDGEFFSRIILASLGILFCRKAQSYYRTGLQQSLSRQKSPEALESLWLSTDLMTSGLLQKENTVKTRELCAYAWKWAAFELYPLHPTLSSKAEASCHQLGGSRHPLHAGGKFRLASKLLGWRLAKRLLLS